MPTFTFLIGSTDPEVYSLTDDVERPDGNIPLDRVIELAGQDPIWANRGKAIQGYAQLEYSLCRLLEFWGDMSNVTASTVFYKIVSTSARISILEKLLHRKHGSTFNLFWNSLVKELRQIDTERNEIVHWLSAANSILNDKNVLLVGVTLIPPASVGDNQATPLRITSKDLNAFEKKCDEFARLLAMFAAVCKPLEGFTPELQSTWRGIFQQPLVYPLPAGHPLFQMPKAPDSQPQSSQASVPPASWWFPVPWFPAP